ncbi:MAG: hypothetical protein WAM79_20060 [Candidatus Sulfotelmatobacter sp.]
MNEKKRPIAVTIVAWLYLLVGIGALIGHFHELVPINRDAILMGVTELLAIVAGVFMLRGQNWARWLALAWMAFHVALSAFPPGVPLVVHCVFFVAIAWALLQRSAGLYFRGERGAVAD